MKHYLFVLSLLLAGAAVQAQPATPPSLTLPINPNTHRIAYSSTIAVPNSPKSELYARGKIWFATALPLDEHIIQTDDKEARVIVGSGVFATNITYGLLVPVSNRVVIKYTIKLSFQEGNYYYTLTDFEFLSGEPHHYSSYLPPNDYMLYSLLAIFIDFQSQNGVRSQDQRRYSVEQLCLDRRKDGTPTHQAANFSQGLDQQMQRLIASIESGMSQAAGGSAW